MAHAILVVVAPGVMGAILGKAILVPCLYIISSPCIRFPPYVHRGCGSGGIYHRV